LAEESISVTFADELLMAGWDRGPARAEVRAGVARVIQEWSESERGAMI